MWWIILIIGVVGYIIYSMNKDYKTDLQTNVHNHDGMKRKYNLLIEYATAHPSAKITKQSISHITIASINSVMLIDYVGGKTEIRLTVNYPVLGVVSKKWEFEDNYPQEMMIEEIENYLTWRLQQLK